MSEDEVQRMVSDAEKYKEADAARKSLIEAKNDADSVRPCTHTRLRPCAPHVCIALFLRVPLLDLLFAVHVFMLICGSVIRTHTVHTWFCVFLSPRRACLRS